MRWARLRALWAAQRVGIKAAILGGVFVLLTGCCAVIAAIITTSPSLIDLSSRAAQTSEAATTVAGSSAIAPLDVEKAVVSSSWTVHAISQDHPIYIVPARCVTFSNGNVSSNVERVASVNAITSFLVVSTRSAIIEDVTITLDSFVLPAQPESLHDLQVNMGGAGGGGINAIDIGSVVLSSAFHQKSLTPIQAYHLDGQDALRFYFDTKFQEPGQYNYHVTVHGRTYAGVPIILDSGSLFLSWILVDNLRSMAILDADFKTPLTIQDCQ